MSITGTNNPFACDPVIFTATNSIVALGTITRVGNAFTFSVGFVWKINGTIYQNAAPITITVAEADAGYNRIDNAILNTSNSIELQQGLPSNAVALQPVEPENAILLTSWDISGASVSEEVPPIVGSYFLQKEFEKSQVVTASGLGVVIPLNIKGRNNIILVGSLTGVNGFSLANLNANPTYTEYPHEGKDYYIQNQTGHSVTLKNDISTVDIGFLSKDGNDIVVPNNGIVFFKNSSNKLQEIFRSYDSFDITLKADLVDGKVPASQLPSYVDDVIEVASFSALPTTGETGKIYVTLDTNKQYRWGGTAYVEIGTSNPFGVHILTKPISGNFYGNMIGLTTDNNISLVASNVYLFPFMPKKTLSIDNMYVNVATAGTSAIGKIAIYSELNGVPNSKLAETGDIDFSTVGIKTIPINFIFIEGVTYWLAYLSNVNCVLRALGSSSCPVISASDPLVSFNQAHFGYFQNSTSVFPNNINSSLLVRTSSGSVKTIFKAL
jgi:hypothetical protein